MPGPHARWYAFPVNELDLDSRAYPAYVDELYRRYLGDPASVDGRGAAFFAGFELGSGGRAPPGWPGNGGAALEAAAPPSSRPVVGPEIPGVLEAVHTFRAFGHFVARIDPLDPGPRDHPRIACAVDRFKPADLDRTIEGAGGLHGVARATVGEILERLRATYGGTLGVEYHDIPDEERRAWIEAEVEPGLNRPELSPVGRVDALRRLVAAEELERFLHKKFVGHKRFSLEGAEAMVPLLDEIVELAAEAGVREIVMGMAHRGRLNVLAHTLRKPYEMILAEFEGAEYEEDVPGDGDVKYHLGYSNDLTTRHGKEIHLSLSPNPSHLELVGPVIECIVRAKQDRRGDRGRDEVLSLQIHGDASFSGQGIVPETLGLCELPAYRTGGTIHVIVDNRLGFTASPADYRYSPYASSVAKIIHAPVFHANADDPEACIQAARLAFGYRRRFHTDAVIDLVCYRRHGHNEVDDPTFTQPVLYERIAAHPSVRALYERRLVEGGVHSAADAARIGEEARGALEAALAAVRTTRPRQKVMTLGGAWKGLGRAKDDWSARTAVPRETLERIARAAARAPEGFSVHPKVRRLLDARVKMVADPAGKIDWACAEMLAFGSLALEGTRVRLAGQDSARGTFSQRHAALRDARTGERFVPLDRLDEKQARFDVIDTMLSELAVLGFEYGYSWADPWTLVLWEAQFGDFVNGSQALIDVFLAAAESKWQRLSGIALLLPHGFEGQGPEHSSARLERFLELAAESNIQVVNPTTPAQYFHVLRRQMRRDFRKPLVVMTPKSLLRHAGAVSTTDELATGGFRDVIPDAARPDAAAVGRVILCSGKVYYPLAKARAERERDDVAIVRLEQLYPFPAKDLEAAIGAFPRAADLVFAQEEPWNMGAWRHVSARVAPLLAAGGRALRYVGRDEAASPATGFAKLHEAEEEAILAEAFANDA